MAIKGSDIKEAAKNFFVSVRKPLLIAGIALILVIISFKSCFVYVKPNEYGIRQINVGIKRGIQEETNTTGYHFILPFGLHIMHKFPRNIQAFELTNYLTSASADARKEKAAHIQTSDGFFVDVDVSVLYRIIDPYKTITTIGPGRLYEDNGIIPKVEPKLKEALGELTTEEFFNSPLRVEKAKKAKELLNSELKPKGIEVEHILIRYFKYSDEIQKNIEEKKLKDQLVFTNQSKAKAATEQAILIKVTQEGEADVKVKLEEGNAYVVKRLAEKDLYVRKKHAEADLLVKLAEAKKTELINTAYQRRGSDKLVGLEMAKVYEGLQVIMLPSSGKYGINPLDLEETLKMLGVSD